MKKALLLLSGGIDSPVAGHLLKDKLELVAVTFHYKPLSSGEEIEKARKLAKKLGIKKLYVIPFAETQQEVVKRCNHKYFYILTRRIMWRTAEKIAEKENAEFLVTGESLGQVASQTLTNLTTIGQAVKIPLLRPLLGFDKNETIKIAREIGTYETSKGPEVCCLLGPKHPATKAPVNVVEKEEEKINIPELIETLLNKSTEEKT